MNERHKIGKLNGLPIRTLMELFGKLVIDYCAEIGGVITFRLLIENSTTTRTETSVNGTSGINGNWKF